MKSYSEAPRLSMIRRRQSSSSAWETLASSQSVAFSSNSKEKGLPDHARKAGQFVRSRRKLCQPRCDYGMHPRALQSGAHTLHHKQRIAPSGPEDLLQVPAFERFRGFEARQFGRLLRIQRLQRNFQNHPRLPQPRHKPGKRMFAARFFRPHGPEHEDTGRGRKRSTER